MELVNKEYNQVNSIAHNMRYSLEGVVRYHERIANSYRGRRGGYTREYTRRSPPSADTNRRPCALPTCTRPSPGTSIYAPNLRDTLLLVSNYLVTVSHHCMIQQHHLSKLMSYGT